MAAVTQQLRVTVSMSVGQLVLGRVRVEGNNSGRGLRDEIASGNADDLEAVAPRVRQADDLLSALRAIAGRHSRDISDLNPGRYPTLQTVVGRRGAVGNQTPLCGT